MNSNITLMIYFYFSGRRICRAVLHGPSLPTKRVSTPSQPRDAAARQQTSQKVHQAAEKRPTRHRSAGNARTEKREVAALLHHLLQRVQRQILGQCSHPDAHWRKTLQLFTLREKFSPKSPSGQTLPDSHGPGQKRTVHVV